MAALPLPTASALSLRSRPSSVLCYLSSSSSQSSPYIKRRTSLNLKSSVGGRALPLPLPHTLKRERGHSRQAAAVSNSAEYEALEGIEVFKADTGEAVPLLSLWDGPGGSPAIVIFLTHFADLSSWEYAQKLKEKILPLLEGQSFPACIAVGLGSIENARKFSDILSFPLSLLYADPNGACYSALGFAEGFGKDLNVSAYVKLFPMLLGIGSPGTIQEVLRGYVGDRSGPPVFSSSTPFDILGTGYQRPFELATLRLFNMAGILPRWGELSPPEEKLLTQQGGTILFNGTEVVFKHMDTGILKYTDVGALMKAIEALPVKVAAEVVVEA